MVKEKDFLYIGLGVGTLYLILRNSKALSSTVKGATGIVNPLLSAASKGASIVTNPESYKTYAGALLDLPFTPAQSWRLFKKEPSVSTGINAFLTSLGYKR